MLHKMLCGEYYNGGYKEYIIQRKDNNDNRLQRFDFRSSLNILSEMDRLTLQFIDYEDKLLELKKVINCFEVNCYLGKELCYKAEEEKIVIDENYNVLIITMDCCGYQTIKQANIPCLAAFWKRHIRK